MAAALDLGRRYPAAVQAHQALSEAGLWLYRQGQRDAAIAAWQLLAGGAVGADQAEGGFWAGAALLEAGDRAAAEPLLQLAARTAPASYYAARARALLGVAAAPSAPLGSAPNGDEQRAVEQWLATWAGAVPPVSQGLLPDVAAAPELQRAHELDAVDLRGEAREEWLAARERWAGDPVRLWQLALLATADGQPYPALKAAERIVALSPEGRITSATPAGLVRLVFPAPYARVVRQFAQQSAVDPRLLLGVMRQESLFNPDATSWVGARGLGQVMPGTAAGIAEGLGFANFDSDDLYRPAVSIQFGAHYLGHQLAAFDGSAQAAAAAYNGGPGNAERWLEQSTDQDLFTELIDFRETRDYVKLVYGNWGMYQLLYQP